MPRTGTTTIQRVLSGLRDPLARHGVCYPDLTPRSAAEPHISHQHLGEALDGRRPAREREELLDRLALLLREGSCSTFVLSYEGLVLAPPKLALPERLATLFARHGFAMETLLTVKPQSEFLNSTYTWRTQFLKEARPFARFLPAALPWPRFDYDAMLRSWRQASAGRVHVVPVRDATNDRPLVERVLALCGVPAALLGAPAISVVENRSPPPLAVETARQIRLRGLHWRLGRNARDATLLIERLVRQATPDSAAFQGIDLPARTIIAARFATRNDRFAASSWGCRWDERVVAQPAGTVNELARSPLEPAVRQAIEDAIGQALARFSTPRALPVGYRMQEAATRLFYALRGL